MLKTLAMINNKIMEFLLLGNPIGREISIFILLTTFQKKKRDV